jgi:hypothetical protein
MFALDATWSRQPTGNEASQMRAEMFKAAGAGLDVQLVYFRGTSECRASPCTYRKPKTGVDRLRIDR